jgi:hypothetical protein
MQPQASREHARHFGRRSVPTLSAPSSNWPVWPDTSHYSLLVFGFNRIPIVAWLREQAAESLTHAQQAGETITHLGEYPSLDIRAPLDTHRTDIGTILRESTALQADAR